MAVLVHLVLLLLGLAPLTNSWGAEARFFRILGPASTTITITITGIAPDGTVTWTNSEVGVTCIVQAAESLFSPTNWNDYVQVPVTNLVTSHRIFDPNPPVGMALIPAGNFTMGDAMGDGDTYGTPTHTVSVSAFYMDKYEVTKAKWDEVRVWALTNGYSFDNAGLGKAASHPVHTVSWYDVVKWCNARSQKEGKTPAYYTDAALTIPYQTGQSDPYVKWDRGYRLPTEAEWEKAAWGGLSGKRFPWGDTITHSQANYYSDVYDAYDTSSTRGYHPSYNDETMPYTSPVGSFAANGYGLYDMAGNVWEWCWDWYGAYGSASQTDPRGPASGSYRVVRGGCWFGIARSSRTANRFIIGDPAYRGSALGFRPVLPPGQ